MTEAAILARRVRRPSTATQTSRRADERELALLYQRDPASRSAVVEALMPLARTLARRYKAASEPREDLEQVATLGLLKALRGFDAERSSSFASYAFPTITGELRRHFRDTGWATHVPRGAKQLALDVTRVERQAAQPPNARETAAALGVPVSDVFEGRRAALAMRTESLDAPSPSYDDDDPSWEPVRGGGVDAGYAAAEHRATIGALTRALTPREREVLALRYGSGLTQAEIGARVGVSQMQVSRILRTVLSRLEDGCAAAA